MTSQDEEQLHEVSDSSDHAKNEAPKGHGIVPVKHKTISCTQCRKRKLKCDRGKPSCGTCSRLHHECVYPEGRVRSAAKRRNVKDLEARLAQVETLLSSEVASKSSSRELPIGNGRPSDYSDVGAGSYLNDFDTDMTMASDMDGATYPSSTGYAVPPLIDDTCFSNDLIGLGLQENLPSQAVMDELHDIYFAKAHVSAPMLQKYRYLANVHFLPPLGPPICLRYAVWAAAASVSEKYASQRDVFYQRARRYAELDEMKGQGEHFITISHAQCWALVSTYEAQTMYLSRAWISAGKCIRMVQMMNLHHLDGGEEEVKRIIEPAKDWMELEERRRVFWTAFCCDRYSCAGTGWPMVIVEEDITTNLPSSEEAYDQGREETTTTLSEAMTVEGAARVSPYAGVVLMACLFGHNWLHLHRPGLNNHPQDFMNGEFWKRHRKMDNVLSNMFMFLPDRLKLSHGLHDPNIVYLNMNLHASIICLHQAAISKAEKHGLSKRIISQSQLRCRAAAQEIVNIMRLISHYSIAEMNTWVAFNLYIATGVLIEGCQSGEASQESRSNLDFLVNALRVMGKKHIVTQAFAAQLKIDLHAAGISNQLGEIKDQKLIFGAFGYPAIHVRNFKTRVMEYPSDMLNHFTHSTGILSSVSGSSESYGTSDKESAMPPQDLHTASDFRKVLPNQYMAESLSATANFGGGIPNDRAQKNVAREIPDFPNTPSLFGQYPVQGEGEAAPLSNHGTAATSTSTEGQGEKLPFTLLREPQPRQSGNGRTHTQETMGGFYRDAANDGVLPDWAFGPVSNPLPPFSGFGFLPDEGQDLNSLLNEEPWDNSTF